MIFVLGALSVDLRLRCPLCRMISSRVKYLIVVVFLVAVKLMILAFVFFSPEYGLCSPSASSVVVSKTEAILEGG